MNHLQVVSKLKGRNRRGLSLVEVIASTLLVGLLMVASLKTVGSVVRTWETTEERFDGTALAMQLMTEVLQASYEEPGTKKPKFGLDATEIIGLRANYDDTDDYDNWTSLPPENKDGSELLGYTGWTRAVIVEKFDPKDLTKPISDGSSNDNGFKRITVTVTDPLGKQTTLIGFRSVTGVMEQSPAQAGTFVTWVGSELQVGTNASKVVAGSNITNHATDQ